MNIILIAFKNILSVWLTSIIFCSSLEAEITSDDKAKGYCVFEVITKLSAKEIVEKIKATSIAKKFSLTDIVCIWQSEGRVFLLVRSRKVSGYPRMTNDQWIQVGITKLEAAGVLKFKSYSKVEKINLAETLSN